LDKRTAKTINEKVKNIVEEHHGSIKANSSYGNGTTFEVILKCV